MRIDAISWKFAAGIHFRSADKWLLLLGISIDTSPVDLEDRAPDVPINRQIRYATEVEYNSRDRRTACLCQLR